MLAEIIFPIPLKKSFFYSVPEEMELTAAPGLRAVASLRNKNTSGLITKILAEKDADLSGIKKIKNIKEILDDEPLFEEPVLEIAEKMSRRWGDSLGLCAGEFYINVPDEMYARFQANCGMEYEKKINLNIPEDSMFPDKGSAFSWEELQIISRIASSFEKKEKKPFLAMLPTEKKHILAGLMAKKFNGGQALFLVSDQEYASYAYKELLPFFGNSLGLWHSQMSPAKKNSTALAAAQGKIRLLIGTRTAAFLPFAKLRLAIADADREECFRNEERAPLYNAAEVLQWRIESSAGTYILCAQCPSAENYGRAAGGRYELANLVRKEKNGGTEIIISDAEKKYVPGSVFSSDLREKIKVFAAEGKKIAVITPRKGFAAKIFCAACGKMLRCPDCGPGLAAVKSSDGETQLLCRRCGKKYPMPEKCPACGQKKFRELGTGTQKAQSELQKLFPDTEIIRYDGDILHGSAIKREAALKGFMCGQTNIMAATKIALNAMPPHSIDLITFINAEEDLSGPDFRSSEKLARSVFAAKSLVKPGGQIILQTREPDNFIFSAISGDSYENFCKEELLSRKFFRYPPYSRLILARFASKKAAAVKACGERLKKISLPYCANKKTELQGPVIPRGQENKTYCSEYWLIKIYSGQVYETLLRAIMSMPQIEGVKYFIEPDPQDFP